MAIKNTVSSIFGPHSSIVKNVFDCPLSVVMFFVDPCDQGVGWGWGRFVQLVASQTSMECQ